MDSIELLLQIKNEVADLKKTVLYISKPLAVSDKWIPRSAVMKFLDYGATQMAMFEKTEGLVVSKIGKRKFYHRDSIAVLLNKNSQ